MVQLGRRERKRRHLQRAASERSAWARLMDYPKPPLLTPSQWLKTFKVPAGFAFRRVDPRLFGTIKVGEL